MTAAMPGLVIFDCDGVLVDSETIAAAVMAAAVGDYMGAAHAADAFGTVTVIFGIGQIIGPALAGVAADRFGGFAASFWLASVLAMAALCLALLLRPPLAATPAAC